MVKLIHVRSSASLTGLLLLLTALGCGPKSPYLTGYRFVPEPAMAVMFKPGSQSPALSVLVSVVGIRRSGSDASTPPAVEIRMRFENSGQQPVTFDPKTLVLVNGSLQSFATPEAHPPHTIQIAAGQTQMVSVFFPIPTRHLAANDGVGCGAIAMGSYEIEDKPYLQTVVFESATQLYYE